jgi:dTMP kinase
MPFISIEGCDGSGKTTQAQILQRSLENQGFEVVLTKEPGGSKFGEMLRNIILSSEIEDSMTEFLMLSAARRDHVLEIQKHLAENKIVITDRFSDSSIAYQGYAKGLPIQDIELITKMVAGECMPDLTILLDVSLEVMHERTKASHAHKTFYDMKGFDFHKKVKEGFLQIAHKYPKRVVIINADLSIDQVSEQIREIISNHI